jgi:hypothetical protein
MGEIGIPNGNVRYGYREDYKQRTEQILIAMGDELRTAAVSIQG